MVKWLYFLCTGVAKYLQLRAVDRHQAEVQPWEEGGEREAGQDYHDAQP